MTVLTLLLPGMTFRTLNLDRAESNAIHASAVATVREVYPDPRLGCRVVKYAYRDYCTIGDFDGRDSDTEDNFRRMFPLRLNDPVTK
jgi:hypothetical protein